MMYSIKLIKEGFIMIKKTVIGLVLATTLVSMTLYSCSTAKNDTSKSTVSNGKISSEQEDFKAKYSELESHYSKVEEDYNSLKVDYSKLEDDYNKLKADYSELEEKAGIFLRLTEEEQKTELAKAEAKRIEEEEKEKELKAEKKRKEKEKKKKEEAERKAKEAKGYETGITYNQLARSPKKYMGEKVKFSGRIVQVIESDAVNQARMSTNGRYDDIILFTYNPNILDVRLLEDDNVTIYGIFIDVESYTTVMGEKVTIPSVLVERIDLK